ncbi:MAG: hypothetical protein CMO80_14855 [Verrucomicrobiales bacterium]|nr:hypothetical protein [Verrucomicrobiales bacterium]|tara:strand:+ start:173 stop:1066 length:894 start_codon:yes stop_codon:yes gene_type:complete
MRLRLMNNCLCLFAIAVAGCSGYPATLPDISTVAADLVLPELSRGKPAAGKRVKQAHPDYLETEVHHILYLPCDWTPDKQFPVIVELAGNGPYKNRYGDVTTGRVEGSKMGYGISAGKDFIWICMPYLNNAGTKNITRWWGDSPKYDPQPTIDYCVKTVKWVCEQFNGDTSNVVLCGFSRGAIACNFIGLYDARIAKLWKAFIPYSHYDGVKTSWPYPGKDRESAMRRLVRLNGRPQFICDEGNNAQATRAYLQGLMNMETMTIMGTGFRNHNDAWLLRPSSARRALREWLGKVVQP